MTGAPKVVCPIAKQSPLDKRMCEKYADDWFDELPMSTHHCHGRLCPTFKSLYPELDTGIRKSEAHRPEPKVSHNCDSAALPESIKEAKRADRAAKKAEATIGHISFSAQSEVGSVPKAEMEAILRSFNAPASPDTRLKELESQLGICMEAIRSLSDRVDQLECAQMALSRAKKVNHPDTP